jgi:hypothetical protein
MPAEGINPFDGLKPTTALFSAGLTILDTVYRFVSDELGSPFHKK